MPTTLRIPQNEVLGEPGTGYENPDGKGPFACHNCHHFDKSRSSCDQKQMKAVSKQPRNPNGTVKVEADGCCEFVDRIGPKRDKKLFHVKS